MFGVWFAYWSWVDLLIVVLEGCFCGRFSYLLWMWCCRVLICGVEFLLLCFVWFILLLTCNCGLWLGLLWCGFGFGLLWWWLPFDFVMYTGDSGFVLGLL